MNREALERMGADELDAYAKALGVSLRGAKDPAQKRRAIETRRERRASMTVLGVDVPEAFCGRQAPGAFPW